MLELQITLRVLNLLRAVLDHEIATIVTIISAGVPPAGDPGGEGTQEGGHDEPGGETGGGGDRPEPGEGDPPAGGDGTETGGGDPGEGGEPEPGDGAGDGGEPSGGDDTAGEGGPEPDPAPDPVPAPVPGRVPVRTIAELRTAIGNARPGDVIPVEGDFPDTTLSGIRPSGRVILDGMGRAAFTDLALTNCGNLALRGFRFVAKGPVAASGATPYLLTGDRATSDITVEGCDFAGALDADAFRTWTKAKWQAQAIGAAFFQGPRVVLRNSAALAVNFGFNLIGRDGIMEDLKVCGFSGDSFRTGSTGLRGRRLWATDAYTISANHPDAFQGFDRFGTLSDQVLEDCIVMEYSTPTDQRNGFGASLQILGYHDGPYAGITFRRVVGACSSHNAYHVNDCAGHIGEKIMLWSVPGPQGGKTKTRVPSSSQLSDVYTDATATGSAPATGKPDYSKLDLFRVAALRSNAMPDLRALMGW